MKNNKKKKVVVKPGIPLGLAVEALSLFLTIFIISKTAPGAWEGTKYLLIGACFISSVLGGLASYDGNFKSVAICASIPAAIKIVLTVSLGQGNMLSAENTAITCALLLGGILGGAFKTRKKKKRKK